METKQESYSKYDSFPIAEVISVVIQTQQSDAQEIESGSDHSGHAIEKRSESDPALCVVESGSETENAFHVIESGNESDHAVENGNGSDPALSAMESWSGSKHADHASEIENTSGVYYVSASANGNGVCVHHVIETENRTYVDDFREIESASERLNVLTSKGA